MPDFSQMSDAELEAIVSRGRKREKPKAGKRDLSKLSDAELEEIVARGRGASPEGVGYGESFARGAAQGATFGFADELVGAAGAIGGALGNDPRSFTDIYRSERDESRQNFAAAEAANPKISLAGNLVGGAFVPLPGGSVAGLARGAVKGAGLARGIGQGAKAGATAGAAFGLGSSEADLTRGEFGGAIADTAKGAATGAALGGGIGAVERGVSRAAQGVFRPTAAGAKAAAAVEAKGGVLTPALQSESRVAKILESVAESSVLGAGAVSKTRGKAIKGAEDEVNAFVGNLQSGLSREEIGQVASDTLNRGVQAFKAQASARYAAVDSATQGATLSLRGVKAAAEQLGKEGLPSKSSGGVLRDFLNLPDTVSFKQANQIRSDLLGVTRDLTDPLSKKAVGQAKLLTKLVSEAIETAQVSPAAKRLLKDANGFYRQGAEVFNSKFVKALASKRPDAIVDTISRRISPESARLLKRVVDPATLEKVQGEYLKQLLEKSMSAQGDIARGTFLSGQKLLTALRASGDRTKQAGLREFLGGKLTDLERLAKILERTQQRTGAGLGGLNVRGGVEVGGLISIGLGGLSPAGIAVTLAPAVLAKAFTNPRFVRLLTRGFSLPAGSPEAARIIAQLSTIATTLDTDQSRERVRDGGKAE